MPASGEFPTDTSRFKLPPSTPEGPVEQHELRSLLFTTIEEALDSAAELDYRGVDAFHGQLHYIEVLWGVGEEARADDQLRLALQSAKDGAVNDHDFLSQPHIEAPQFLREQAIAQADLAVVLHRTGREEEAQNLITAACIVLTRAAIAENTPGMHIPDMYRQLREESATLRLSGCLAGMGEIDEAETMRKSAELSLHTYEAHMEALEHQKRAAGENSATYHAAVGLQMGVISEIRRGMEEALLDQEMSVVVGAGDIVRLCKIAAEYDIDLKDVGMTSLLEAYERNIPRDRLHVLPPNPGSDVRQFRYIPRADHEKEEDYLGIADAYFLVGDPDKAAEAIAKAVPYVGKRLGSGDEEALETFAAIDLKLRSHRVDARIARIALRYRLGIRYEQAQIAFEDHDIRRTTDTLDVAIEELRCRLEEAAPDEDEFETGMGLRFAAMFGEMGEYDRMEAAYEMLKEHNENGEAWENYMPGRKEHAVIARHFLSGGNVVGAFGAIRYADDVEKGRFLINVMKTACDPGRQAIEAIVIDQAELHAELRHFAAYLQERRQSQP